jgi:hypothetical protein
MRWRLRDNRAPLGPHDQGWEMLGRDERAVARFNASEAGHAVSGLVRTLGSPLVSVGASAGVPGQVRITVAWELSWYQWGVDLGDDERPVFELGKGCELHELDSAARHWNAVAIAGGRLVMSPPARRHAADDGARRG